MKRYSVGSVNWYKVSGKIYGVIILDHLCETNDYFIGISEEIIPEGKTPTIDEILRAKPYTAAWFWVGSLLNPIRMHYVGSVTVNGSYANRGGRYISEELNINRNVGMNYTWQHSARMMIPHWDSMNVMLNSRAFPTTWIYNRDG